MEVYNIEKYKMIRKFLLFLLKEDIYAAYIENYLMMFNIKGKKTLEGDFKRNFEYMNASKWISGLFIWDDEIISRKSTKYTNWNEVNNLWRKHIREMDWR